MAIRSVHPAQFRPVGVRGVLDPAERVVRPSIAEPPFRGVGFCAICGRTFIERSSFTKFSAS